MPAYSQAKIKQFLKAADTATTNPVKGKAFEDLICYLFEKIPGVILPQRDVRNTFASEEIDVAFYNEQDPKGLKAFNPFLLIECKNWSATVGSAEVGSFISKIRNRGLDFGILVAAQGITGSAADGKQAHHQATLALKDKIQIVVLTRLDLQALKTTEELVTLIKTKVCQLIASGTVWS
ncbi:MAG: restriction endonuclease [Gemmataceae bacterium]|nr:restriction endonuclease [Gemmataceae bacterium]